MFQTKEITNKFPRLQHTPHDNIYVYSPQWKHLCALTYENPSAVVMFVLDL